MKKTSKIIGAETEFLSGLIELQYGQKVQEKLRKIAPKVSWAKGWPEDQKAFWNAEAFMWQRKIEKEKRKLIEQELQFLKCQNFMENSEHAQEPVSDRRFLTGKNNLDLGCGAYSYISSVGIDFSEKMLQFNEACSRKIKADLEERLPLKDGSFDSATAIFVLNYIQNPDQLLKEICRVLKQKGYLVAILWSKTLNSWYQQQEQNHISKKTWKEKITQAGFKVQGTEKEGIWFFIAQKQKTY